MIKAMIVEDLPDVAAHLCDLLNRHFADIQVLDVCDTIDKSLASIQKHQPELIFMDVELHPPEKSFEILRRLASINFKIIFTTAYDHYAIQAIKFSALDYLLKPIDEELLQEAVGKFVSTRSITSAQQHQAIINYEPGNQQTRIGLPDQDGVQFVKVSDIIYCEGQSAQTSVHLLTGKENVISRTLKDCVEILEPFDFCRIHKSYFINLRHVDKYHKGDGGYVVMDNGKHLDVSKTYKDEFLSRLRKV